MKRLLYRAALIPILIGLLGLHARRPRTDVDVDTRPTDTDTTRRSRSPLPGQSHRADSAETRTRIQDARVGQGSTIPYVGDGPVEFKPPARGFTREERRQAEEYVAGGNEAINEGSISPTGRVSTTENTELERDARNRARQERRAAENDPDRQNYQGIVAHLPDTGWMNPETRGVPVAWGDHSLELNSSLASQSSNYPVGYKPTEFRLSPEWYTQTPLDDL